MDEAEVDKQFREEWRLEGRRTFHRRKTIKDFYEQYGHHDFFQWGRFMYDKEAPNVWYLRCRRCYQSLVYDDKTREISPDFPDNCPGYYIGQPIP